MYYKNTLQVLEILIRENKTISNKQRYETLMK